MIADASPDGAYIAWAPTGRHWSGWRGSLWVEGLFYEAEAVDVRSDPDYVLPNFDRVTFIVGEVLAQ